MATFRVWYFLSFQYSWKVAFYHFILSIVFVSFSFQNQTWWSEWRLGLPWPLTALPSHCYRQGMQNFCVGISENASKESANLQEIPKITFFNSQSSTQPITPHKSMYPMVSYFITNLPVPIFTSQNMNLIRPATPEIKYVQKFNWIDGHGVSFRKRQV